MIERLAEHVVYTDRYLTVFNDAVRFPTGAEGRYLRVQSGTGFPGVVILPVRDGHLGLVRQFRYATGAALWEAPRGSGESEDTEAEARRELAEETGATGARLVDLGHMYPDTGLLTTRVALYLAHLDPGTPFAAVDEVDAAAWMPVEDVVAQVASGEIVDGFTIAAVSRAQLRGLLTP